MHNFKYIWAYIVPVTTLVALSLQGIYSFLTVILVFVLIPIIEPFSPNSIENLSSEQQDNRGMDKLYDFLLYMNVPILYGLLFLFVSKIMGGLSPISMIGSIFSMGITMGAIGINVAHELGHKKEYHKRQLARILLWPSFYLHFTKEHNQGHHKNVATDEDPASARKNEIIYTFWIKSLSGTFTNAWRIQLRELRRKQAGFFSMQNEMLGFALAMWLLVSFLYIYGGGVLLVAFLSAALVSVLLLETINYVEHYGLRRRLQDNGRYEKVSPAHSWNSNHEIGRILLYELTRHSDHHFLAHKKYQLLDSHKQSKQLPFGYPTAMLVSLIPPLWFKIMNPKL